MFQTIGYFNFTSEVEIHRIESSRFTPIEFSQFIRLFRNLDTFIFSESSFCCQCIPIPDKNHCKICNDCGFKELSKVSTIERLGLFRLKNSLSLIDSIQNYKSLNAMICCEFDLKQLVQKCITFAQNLSNIFTIILHSTEENLKRFAQRVAEKHLTSHRNSGIRRI
jgi:hypothetical protein